MGRDELGASVPESAVDAVGRNEDIAEREVVSDGAELFGGWGAVGSFELGPARSAHPAKRCCLSLLKASALSATAKLYMELNLKHIDMLDADVYRIVSDMLPECCYEIAKL